LSAEAPTFTKEDIAEWASFGPGKPEGKPPYPADVLAAVKAAKPKRKAFSKELAKKMGLKEAKCVKALDAAVLENTGDLADSTDYGYLSAPSGTRDFYPEDLAVQSWLFENMRARGRSGPTPRALHTLAKTFSSALLLVCCPFVYVLVFVVVKVKV
jgi:hypothetical protein